jgi:hypothetical protein
MLHKSYFVGFALIALLAGCNRAPDRSNSALRPPGRSSCGLCQAGSAPPTATGAAFPTTPTAQPISTLSTDSQWAQRVAVRSSRR